MTEVNGFLHYVQARRELRLTCKFCIYLLERDFFEFSMIRLSSMNAGEYECFILVFQSRYTEQAKFIIGRICGSQLFI
jgi:hypothetical protein